MSGDPAKLPSDLAPMTEATWYAFAKNGDPNNAKIPTWKKYDTTDRETMVMGQSGKNIKLSSDWNLKSDPRAKERKAFIWQPQDVSGN
jgi:Carboxylesterase type B